MSQPVKKFLTENGEKIPAITTDQMREVDRVAMEETGPNLFQMMENAGRNLAELTFEKIGANRSDAKIIVLAGTGGNGGGGICAARHLVNHGFNVKLCISDTGNLGEIPSFQRKIYKNAGGLEIEFDELGDERAGIILDAVIGYSLKSAPYGMPQEMILWANEQDALKFSLDVPSGIDSTSGETPGVFIAADHTLTLALPKTGLLPHLSGELQLADIGIPKETYKIAKIPYRNPFGSQFRINIEAEI